MGIYLERGRILFRQLRYDLAEKELLRELAQEPGSSTTHALLGLCRGRLQRHAEGVESCHEAVRLAPDSAYAHYALAYLLDDLDRIDEAATAIGESLRLDPSDPDYHALLAYIRARQRRYEDSLAIAEAGLRLDATHIHCLNRRAMALAYLKRPAEAEQVLGVALAQDPLNPVTLANHGWVLLEQGKPGPALEQLSEALRLDPRMSWARNKTTEALELLVGQGRPAAAVKHFSEALRRDPELEGDRQRLVQALLKRLPRALTGGILVLWVGLCLIALGPDPRPGLLVRLIPLVVYTCLLRRRFVLLDPLCFLLLRLQPLGRLVLSPRQVRASTTVGLLFAVALIVVPLARVVDEAFAHLVAMTLLALVLPLANVFLCRPGGHAHDIMATWLLVLAVGACLLVVMTGFNLVSDAAVACQVPGVLRAFMWDAQGFADWRDLLFLVGVGVTGLLSRGMQAQEEEVERRKRAPGK